MDGKNCGQATLALDGSSQGTKRLEPIWIGDDAGFSNKHFIIPSHYEASVGRVLIPYGMILDRIEKLAYDIKQYFGGDELHLLCVLKGSRGFFNHLLSFLNKIHTYASPTSSTPPYMEHYVRLRSYKGTQSSGSLEVISEDLSCLKHKRILIVEDIIDTGFTLTKFCEWLQRHEPKCLGVASLLEKRTSLSNGFRGNFVGFSVPDVFIVGFSLDYNEMFRDLEHVCVLNERGQEKYKQEDKQG